MIRSRLSMQREASPHTNPTNSSLLLSKAKASRFQTTKLFPLLLDFIVPLKRKSRQNYFRTSEALQKWHEWKTWLAKWQFQTTKSYIETIWKCLCCARASEHQSSALSNTVCHSLIYQERPRFSCWSLIALKFGFCPSCTCYMYCLAIPNPSYELKPNIHALKPRIPLHSEFGRDDW